MTARFPEADTIRAVIAALQKFQTESPTNLLVSLPIMKKTSLLPCLLACAVVVAGFAQQSSIAPAQLRTWLTYIASDDLEGRATFSEGLGLAAAYIADRIQEAGVKPAGDHGTYFQRVEVLGVKSTNRSTVTVEVNGETRTFKNGEGVRFDANVGGKRSLTLNHVEFVGYGLNLGADRNDYKGVDAKDKAVVWLGAHGPAGTDQQQVRRLLNAREDLAIEEMGAAAAIAPPPDN